MEFLQNLIGAGSAQHFLSLMFFALIGATANLWHNVKKRDVYSDSTPMDFNFWFMLQDNFKRMVATLILIYLFVRFMPLLIPSGVYETIAGDVEFVLAALIGFGFDKLSEFLKDKLKFLSVNRDAINKETREVY